MAKAPKRKWKRDYLFQLNVLVSDEAVERLKALQQHYATRAGLLSPVTQAEAVEIVLRDAAVSAGIEKAPKGTAR